MKPPDEPAEPPWTDAERMAWFEEKRRHKEPPPRRRAEPTLEQRLEISTLSSQWAESPRGWTESDQRSWDALLTLCREIEENVLRQDGVPVKRIRELVRTEFAWWDSSVDDFKVSLECPDNIHAVPVVTCFRDGEFRIPADVHNLLWDHPLLVAEIEQSGPRNQRDRFRRLLERIRSIAEAHDLHDWEIIPYVAEQDGPDQLAAKCVMAEFAVRHALDSIYGMGFSNELYATSDTGGNTGARPLGQICILLNATVELGRALEHYTMSRNSRVEETIRRLSEINPGRGATAEGDAVLEIVKAYVNEKSIQPTALKLLKFLRGKKDPGSDGKPLIVDHPLWSEVLQGVSWSSFKTLVQSANRRL